MKKLFASMLAATMVAGMNVSAFAYVNAKGVSATADALTNVNLGIGTDGYDFAINATKAVDSDGKTVTKLSGGDKIYYPIVVSGEELEIGSEVATDYYYATKSSEVDGLSVKIDVEAGSKYVDGVSIVKEDLGLKAGEVTAEAAVFEVDFTGVTVGAGAAGTTGDGTYKITLAYDGGAAVDGETVNFDAVASVNSFVGKSITIEGETFNITAGSAAGKLKFTSVNAKKVVIPAAKNFVVDTAIVNPDTSADGSIGTVTAGGTVLAPAADYGVDGATGTSIGKIYCVQVKMADYFGDEAKEVEFNLSLKNSSRVVFETEDDATSFAGEFDLGQDSKTLTAAEYKKFRNNELTLEIDDKTGVVALDEAYLADGVTKEDIEFIYLEGKDANFTFDVKASGQDDLYLELNQDAIKEIAVANSKADLTFYTFPGEPEFDFSGTARFGVEDEDKDNYFYEIVDGELVESKAKYNEEDGVFELRTNKLGSYVISDKELDTTVIEDKEDNTEDKEDEETGGDTTTDGGSETSGDKDNANTGAADLIGVASALAVVSVAVAGAVALKK